MQAHSDFVNKVDRVVVDRVQRHLRCPTLLNQQSQHCLALPYSLQQLMDFAVFLNADNQAWISRKYLIKWRVFDPHCSRFPRRSATFSSRKVSEDGWSRWAKDSLPWWAKPIVLPLLHPIPPTHSQGLVWNWVSSFSCDSAAGTRSKLISRPPG